MSITISITNGVRIVHLRGPSSDPLTQKLAQFIGYQLSQPQPKPRRAK